MEGKRKNEVLVVGINSFLGNAISTALNKGYVVTGIYHRSTNNLPSDIPTLAIDKLETLRDAKFKHIYLVGAYVPQPGDNQQMEKLYRANIELPQILSELFPQARVILCSSVSVYEGVFGTQIINEHTGVLPESAYAISKLWSEQIIRNHASFGILRISSLYGLGMKQTTFIPKIIENALVHKHITLLGKGERLQNYIHVLDVARLAIRLADSQSNGIYLAVADRSYANLEIAEIIQRYTGCTLSFTGKDTSKSSVYDNKYTLEAVGGMVFEDIETRLKEFIEWKRKQY